MVDREIRLDGVADHVLILERAALFVPHPHHVRRTILDAEHLDRLGDGLLELAIEGFVLITEVHAQHVLAHAGIERIDDGLVIIVIDHQPGAEECQILVKLRLALIKIRVIVDIIQPGGKFLVIGLALRIEVEVGNGRAQLKPRPIRVGQRRHQARRAHLAGHRRRAIDDSEILAQALIVEVAGDERVVPTRLHVSGDLAPRCPPAGAPCVERCEPALQMVEQREPFRVLLLLWLARLRGCGDLGQQRC